MAVLNYDAGVQPLVEDAMQQAVHKYLKALEAGDAEKAASLFVPGGWVQSPFLGRLPVRDYVAKVARASSDSKLTVYDVLVSAEGHLRAVAYYHYDWSLKDGSNVAFDCADVFNFDPETGRIESIVLVYDTQPVRDIVEDKYP
jgi:ketosteroid isomerase-like protein